jgi:hypothetical protein
MRSKIAELKVPAWAIPTHQTKFTIANPHATGMFTPQTPTPFAKSQETAKRKIISSRKAALAPIHH